MWLYGVDIGCWWDWLVVVVVVSHHPILLFFFRPPFPFLPNQQTNLEEPLLEGLEVRGHRGGEHPVLWVDVGGGGVVWVDSLFVSFAGWLVRWLVRWLFVC